MNITVLIDSIVRQVTVLIAQLATVGGTRSPVAHLANQVFVQLARELESQGVSRKVSADMFGMALRAYVRKVRRLSEAESEPGITLWRAVLEFVRGEKLVARRRLLERFGRDDELSLSGVLHDLTRNGLIFASGAAEHAVYRAASDEELGEFARLSPEQGLEELAWVLAYREGPLADDELAARLGRTPEDVGPVLERLLLDGRVQRRKDGRLVALDCVVPLGATAGWEAAVFDHVQAVVQTICQRLRQSTGAEGAHASDAPIGGSTYSFDVWAGHPLEADVKRTLGELRERLGELRRRVDDHNRSAGLPAAYQQVVTYLGQCILDRDRDGLEADDEKEGAPAARDGERL
jgi:hypothetical protein